MTHDAPLVILSFMAALLASYTALDMGTRLRRATGRVRVVWLVGSAVVLGGGIWSMHFLAMLAMNAGLPIAYSFDLTALSLITAIAIVAFGFHLVTRPKPSIARQITAGVIVGGGVAAMHYTGMAALILNGAISYEPWLVAASVLVAVVAATAALWLTLNLTRPWQRAAAAVVMAIAVCGMHYTAMLATTIRLCVGKGVAIDPASRLELAAAVSIGLFLLLCLAMVCVFADRHFEFLADREAEGLRAANKALTESQDAIRNLIDNADQGFLTIGPDLRVGDQLSAACEAILGGAPTGLPVVELLLGTTAGELPSTLRTTLESVFRDSTDLARELKLELLPREFDLGGKAVLASYKFLADSGRLMLILTDVTKTRQLTLEVERERQRLEMIVLAVTEGDAFAALANDYRRFLDEELPQLILRFDDPASPGELYRRLHTFKGLLAQFSFLDSPAALHAMEDRLAVRAAWTARAADKAFAPKPLLAALTRDLGGVADILGPDFARVGRRLVVSRDQLQAMETLARSVLAGQGVDKLSPSLRLLLQTLAELGLMDVKAALALHSRGASNLAARLDKQLAPIVIDGDDVALPPERYGEFFRSLVHLFRNAVDHGVEAPEERVAAGKSAEGLIRCDIRDCGDAVEIVITDDGRGVDRRSLEDQLVASGMDRRNAGALSLDALVFREGLSSRDAVSDVSGRGVGLAAVKSELDRLGGSVSVTSDPGRGAQFRFHLPTGRGGRVRLAVNLQRAV
jgi:NO-binding membrane sensor protein with MHYT domain